MPVGCATRRRMSGAWVGAALLSGCSFVLAPEIFVQNACKTDADCADGVCDLESLICVGKPKAVFQIGLEISPATDAFGQSPAPMSLGPLPVDGPTERNIQLPGSITVEGQLRWAGVDGPLPVEVDFVLASPFRGGRDITVSAQTNGPGTLAPANDGIDYSVRLMGNTSYDVSIRPSVALAERLPPLRYPVDFSETAGGDVLTFDIVYPNDALATLGGVILGSLGAPRDGLRIVAIDRTTRAVVSSTATSGAHGEPGAFELVLAPGATDYVLRVLETTESDHEATRPGLASTLWVDPAYAFPGETLSLLVPEPPEVLEYSGHVSAEGVDTIVAQATLIFRGRGARDAATGIEREYSTTAMTDEAGFFSVGLPSATYDVLVTPPPDAALSVQLARDIQVSATSADDERVIDLLVPRQMNLGGRVVTPDGQPVAGATVQALARGVSTSDASIDVGAYNRTRETVTNDDGSFSVTADLGVYDVIAKPPTGSRYSWFVLPAVHVTSDTTALGSDLVLPAPVPYRGKLRDPSNTPAAGAEILAFGLIDDERGAPRTVPLGRAVSAADGAYELLLTPSLVPAE